MEEQHLRVKLYCWVSVVECVCVCVCWDTVISVQVDPVWPFDGGRNVRVSGTGECRRGVCFQSEREVRLVSSV